MHVSLFHSELDLHRVIIAWYLSTPLIYLEHDCLGLNILRHHATQNYKYDKDKILDLRYNYVKLKVLSRKKV